MDNVDTCKKCGATMGVYHTRNNKRGRIGDMIRRIRECPVCLNRHSTIELLESEYESLVLSDGSAGELRARVLEVLNGSD